MRAMQLLHVIYSDQALSVRDLIRYESVVSVYIYFHNEYIENSLTDKILIHGIFIEKKLLVIPDYVPQCIWFFSM